MQYDDERDYIMRMIKEIARILFSLMLGKEYVQVEPAQENRYEVAGRGLDAYKQMVDRGEINEAENRILSGIDYDSREQVAAATLFYQYLGEQDAEYLTQNNYSRQEVLEGLRQLARHAGYADLYDTLETIKYS